MDTAFLYSQDTLAELMTNIFSDTKLKVSFNDTMSNSLSQMEQMDRCVVDGCVGGQIDRGMDLYFKQRNRFIDDFTKSEVQISSQYFYVLSYSNELNSYLSDGPDKDSLKEVDKVISTTLLFALKYFIF